MSKSSMVEFQCIKKPDMPSLSGFEVGKTYKGRSFNGLFQIAPVWGGDMPTMMVERRDFSKFFAVVQKPGVDIAA
jgi:hypothetical protein